MKTSFIEINDRNLFKEIKAKLDPKSYVECGGCGAVKYDDSWGVARIVNEMLNDCWDDKIDYEEAILSEGLFQLIECEPDIKDDKELFEWYERNQYRHCEFWDGSECYYYKLYDDVVLFYDKSCKCFNKS